MNIGMLLLVIIGGFAGLLSSIHNCMEDLSPGCQRYPDHEVAVSFNILIPNKNAGAIRVPAFVIFVLLFFVFICKITHYNCYHHKNNPEYFSC